MVKRGTLQSFSLSTHPNRADLEALRIGNVVYLDGVVYTGREGVYKKVVEDGADLPPYPTGYQCG